MKNPRPILSVCLSLFLLAPQLSSAAEAGTYVANDLLLFFRNPSGTAGTTTVTYFNLGSTYNVFRVAATPGSSTYGTTIPLGNIGEILTETYGADWTTLSSTIFAGAQGQNGATSALATSTTNGDYARTTYVTKPRQSAGSFGQANSASPLYDPATTGVPSAISGANNIRGITQPGTVVNDSTTLDDQNPIVNGNPGTAYNAFQGGIIGDISSATYSYGSVSGVVLGLDLFRVTKTTGTGTDNGSIWQTANNINDPEYTATYPGGSARADYLGTIVLTAGGDVYFVAVIDQPEPPVDDYTTWASGYPGANLSDKEADFDKDGFKNVSEYAFGTDPTVGTPSLLSSATVSNNLVVSFFRRSGLTGSVPSYTALATTNLTAGFSAPGIPISPATNAAPLGYEAAAFSQPVSGRSFYRVQATLP